MRILWMALVIALGMLAGAVPALASTVLDFEQSGSDVVATISGSLDLPAPYLPSNSETSSALLSPIGAVVQTSSGSLPYVSYQLNSADPHSFGTSVQSHPTSNPINVPFWLSGYQSLLLLATTDQSVTFTGALTYADSTLASLGLNTGVYTYTLDNDETFTVEIGVLPVPASLGLLLSALAGLAAFGWWRGRRMVQSEVATS